MQALTPPHFNIHGHHWLSLVSHVRNTS